MNVYERVQELSKKQGISVRELGDKLGIGSTTLYKWKTQIPKSDILVKVADYFGVSVDYLLDRETPSHTDIDLEKALDNAMTFEGRALTDEERTAMKEILKAYLKTKK
jgi:transcriptional regulator with XRE-family HTH domain